MIDPRKSCAVVVGLVGAVLVATPRGAEALPCDPWDCGTNTPMLYGDVIDAVSLTPTLDAPYVLQGSLRVDSRNCAAGRSATHLGVVDGELVGMWYRAGVLVYPVCRGAQLKNAGFDLRIGTKRVHVKVASVVIGRVFTWEIDGEKRRQIPVYRFTNKDGAAVCTKRPWMDEWQIGNLPPAMWHGSFTPSTRPVNALGEPIVAPAAPGGVPPIAWSEPTDAALLYQGETYDRNANVDKTGPQWISIGCAGRGVAKMRLMGFNPMINGTVDLNSRNRASTDRQRVATAKMITARYQGSTSFTLPDMPLLWLHHKGIVFYGDPSVSDAAIGPLESVWTDGGAPCLSHMRLARQGFLSAAAEAARQSAIGLATCSATIPRSPIAAIRAYVAAGNGSNSKSVWTTFTYGHVAHP